ncbi:MAG: hypothetical protein M3217_09805 [Actinomycetota bacterium]|nr:hypothetical protein [Actinomycetota bacterium]
MRSAEHVDLAKFARLVRARSGLVLEGARLRDLERAIALTMESTGTENAAALHRLLEDRHAGRAALRSLLSAITIGETYFFRHTPQMTALEQRILPEIVARHADDRRLRIWSAGCSTGEEAYSLAILLRRVLPEIAGWDVTVLATDVDVDALEKARRGVYRPWSFRGASPDLQRRYFMESQEGWEVLRTIREMVTFEYLNLAEDVYPSLATKTLSVDLVLCRNVFIYLDEATTARVVEGLHAALVDRGWLVVGPAEPSQETFRRFDAVNLPGTTVYRKPARARDRAFDERRRSTPAGPRAAEPPVGEPHARAKRRSVRPSAPSTAPSLRTVRTRKDDILALEREVAANPGSAEAPYLLARVHANRLELESAARWVEVALERDPLLAAAHHLHALVLQERGQPDAAFEALRRCTYADPSYVLGHFATACLLESLGRRSRALRSLAIVEALLDARDDAGIVDAADGLTVGRLRRLVEERRETWSLGSGR